MHLKIIIAFFHPYLGSTSLATDPTSVDEPSVSAVTVDFLCEHGGVLLRMQDQERSAEASRKRRLGFDDAILSTRNLCGVPRDKVVHDLGGRELRDRREDAERIASEQNDVLGMTSYARDLRIGDEIDGIGATGVLGEAVVSIFDDAGVLVEDDVLEDGPKANGVEDVGFLLGREVNALGVAPALDVEDARIRPAVLIVADQLTVGVRRERRLARTREAKEERDVTIGTFVSRRVEREDAGLWH
ncbi:hypothetical protein BC938DRAFT_472757 [Jimgerdemannia flammicorona]|uniref:Uncharacterized protein n=1 Tax=Jimgerdemannia flammicorona TaxID=994334 RepID=A0A433Q5E4_9FUNG|nr:hypothetical protein BC938DRAFT_472757 [Jimgerdemannia flammicorona]